MARDDSVHRWGVSNTNSRPRLRRSTRSLFGATTVTGRRRRLRDGRATAPNPTWCRHRYRRGWRGFGERASARRRSARTRSRTFALVRVRADGSAFARTVLAQPPRRRTAGRGAGCDCCRARRRRSDRGRQTTRMRSGRLSSGGEKLRRRRPRTSAVDVVGCHAGPNASNCRRRTCD